MNDSLKVVLIKDISNNFTFWGISSDTIFTTLITILIFFLGFSIRRIFERKKELNRLKDVKIFFLLYIKSLIDPINEYIASLSELTKKVEDINNQEISFSDNAKLAIDENIVNQLDLFKAFVFNEKSRKKENIQNLKTILNSLLIIKQHKINLKENFFRFFDDLRRYEKKLKESTNAVLRCFDEYLSEALRAKINLDQDLFLKGFKELIAKWHKIENYNFIEITKINMIDPLKEFCRQNIQDPRALRLIPLLINFRDAYLNIVVVRKIYIDYFAEVKNDLIIKKNNIENALKHLNET